MQSQSQTGDLKNNIDRLKALTKSIRFPGVINYTQVENGDPRQLLAILHYCLLEFSRDFAKFLIENGYELYGKTDVKFIEGVFKLLRNLFSYLPSISTSQFLSPRCAERKIILVCDTLLLVREKHKELKRIEKRKKTVWYQPGPVPSYAHHGNDTWSTNIKKDGVHNNIYWTHANLGVEHDIQKKRVPKQEISIKDATEEIKKSVPTTSLDFLSSKNLDAYSLHYQSEDLQEIVKEPKVIDEVTDAVKRLSEVVKCVEDKVENMFHELSKRLEDIEIRMDLIEKEKKNSSEINKKDSYEMNDLKNQLSQQDIENQINRRRPWLPLPPESDV